VQKSGTARGFFYFYSRYRFLFCVISPTEKTENQSVTYSCSMKVLLCQSYGIPRYFKFKIYLTSSVADPDPGSGAFLTLDPGSGMGKKSGSGSVMNNPDHISYSLETIFWG
jgi:hypothetical protein